MMRIRIAHRVERVTADFIEIVEHFSDGTTEFAVYYFKNDNDACFID